MTFPGLVRANNLNDVVDKERAWNNLGASIRYPAGESKLAGGDQSLDIFDPSGGAYRLHVFTTVGSSLLVVNSPVEIEYLVIAGGGGSGGTASATAAGAGGAGGLLSGTIIVSIQNYSIVVGNGGIGGGANVRGSQGGNTSAFGLTAIGGGGGGGGAANVNGGSGGSGGSGGGGGTGGAGTSGQGNNGGGQWGYGGGAGFSGSSATTPGQGLQFSITGTALWYAGGGGSPFGDPKPLGGGGRGDTSTGANNAEDGTPNTGGGAGARWGLRDGRSGGSGVVIIRYRI